MKKVRIIPVFLVAVLLLVSCKGTPQNAQQAAAATNHAAKTLPVLAYIPNPSETPTSTPTQTLVPTETLTSTPTSAPTLTLAPTRTPRPTRTPLRFNPRPLPGDVDLIPGTTGYYTSCNMAEFVSDISIPDYTELLPAQVFVKTWRIKNIGFCTWNDQYDFVYYAGDRIGGPLAIDIPHEVAPGETIDISVAFTSPADEGVYGAIWMLRDSDHQYFGTGQSANQGFLVVIISTEYAPQPFAVYRVITSVDMTSYTGACPATFTFEADIYANGPGTVTYYWLRSDGSRGGSGTLTYDFSSFQTVTDTWTLGGPGSVLNASNSIYIELPNNQGFAPADITVNCS